MLKLFVVIFVILAAVMALMAVGVIFGRKPLQGSCGGLGAVGVDKACGCQNGCANESVR